MTRVRLTLIALLSAAVAGTGLLTKAAAWPASPTAGLTVAAASVITITSAALALRVLVVLTRVGSRVQPAPVRVDDHARHRP